MTSACLARTNRRNADARRRSSDGDVTLGRMHHVSYRERRVSSDSISPCIVSRTDGGKLDSRCLEYHLLQFDAWKKDDESVADDAAFVDASETRPNRRDVDSARPNRGSKTSRRFEVRYSAQRYATDSKCCCCRDGGMKNKRRFRNCKPRWTI